MQVVISDVDQVRGKTVYTDVTTIDVAEFTEEEIYHAVRQCYGVSEAYMSEATIKVGRRIAAVSWEGITFNMIRDAALPHF